jgi:GTP-binding protein
MTTELAKRQSLRGLFLIMDSRRGMLPGDQVLLGWAAEAHRPVHVLLSKSDKLKRTELSRELARVRAALAGVATVQSFSAVSGDGVVEARECLDQWLAGAA